MLRGGLMPLIHVRGLSGSALDRAGASDVEQTVVRRIGGVADWGPSVLAAADESLLTGEAALVPKGVGSRVTAGTVNYEGPLVIRALSTGENSTLAGIGRLVSARTTGRRCAEQAAMTGRSMGCGLSGLVALVGLGER